jgi:hypothetical protein
MLCNHVLRYRQLLLLLGFVLFVYVANRFYSISSPKTASSPQPVDQTSKGRKITQKFVEINDRQPSYKLYIYEGYETTLNRNRAQVKVLDDIKLHDTCQKNPKTIVVDIGASLGNSDSFSKNHKIVFY